MITLLPLNENDLMLQSNFPKEKNIQVYFYLLKFVYFIYFDDYTVPSTRIQKNRNIAISMLFSRKLMTIFCYLKQ